MTIIALLWANKIVLKSRIFIKENSAVPVLPLVWLAVFPRNSYDGLSVKSDSAERIKQFQYILLHEQKLYENLNICILVTNDDFKQFFIYKAFIERFWNLPLMVFLYFLNPSIVSPFICHITQIFIFAIFITYLLDKNY